MEEEFDVTKVEFGVEDLWIEAVGVVAIVVLEDKALGAEVREAVGIEEVELGITDRVFEVGVREGVDVEMV